MSFTITADEKKILLADARETITARLEKREPKYSLDGAQKNSIEKSVEKSIEDGTSALTKPCGAFVTLHSRLKRSLRGCIGRMSASSPLQKTVRIMAIEAAFGDPRFPPLQLNELSGTSIEISALSPMELCEDPRSVRVGVHGLYLVHRGRSGVLLPQVPIEQGWNLDESLDYI